MPLSHAQIEAFGPRSRPYKVFDGRGLYVYVRPDGSKLWRLKYRIAGKEKLLTIGLHPEVSIEQAREAREEAQALIQAGIDPVAHRRERRIDEQYLNVDPVVRGYPRVSALPGNAIEIATENRSVRLTQAEAREVLHLLGDVVKEERPCR